MRRIYLICMLCYLSIAVNAQTAASYTFARTTGSYTSIAGADGTTATSSISGDDYVQQSIPIGFSFNYCGTDYTTLSACSNGWLSLHNSSSTVYYNISIDNAADGGTGFLMCYWDDLYGSGYAYYQTSGTAPNRVFTFQWGDPSTMWGSYTGSGNATFQVKLYESSKTIQYIYGPTTYSGKSATIGIANSTTDFQDLASESSTVATTGFYSSASVSPASNTVMTWTPAVSCSTPGIATGTLAFCAGAASTLSDTTSGGTWSSSNTAVATVSSDGVVTGNSGGTSTISYTVPGGCSSTVTVTINASPAGIASTAGGGTIGNITTIAGNGTYGYSGDGGPATAAVLSPPYGLATDASGNIYVSDPYDYRIRKISASGIITNFAGSGAGGYSGDGGQATDAALNFPIGVAVDTAGNVYFADYGDKCVRKISPSGIISTFAGTGVSGYSGDGGPASAALLSYPSHVAVDAAGNVYISDALNNRVRKVNASGIISTIAGNGTTSYGGDGSAATATGIAQPFGIVADAAGNVYVGSYLNKVFKINTSGVISTFAGGGMYLGDDGPATDAQVSSNVYPTIGSNGTVYLADYGFNRVRQVNTAGIISTIAGNGSTPSSGDGGPATAAMTQAPLSITVDAGGNVLVGEYSSYTVRKITISGAGLCVGATTMLSSATTGGTWSSSATGVVTVGSTGMATGVSAGTATITYTGSEGCYTTSVVTVNALPIVGTTGAATICAGSTATLSGTGATTYAWTGGITNGVPFAPTSTATYTVTGTDANSCSSTATAVVSVNATLAISAGASSVICAGESRTLTASGASSYSWSPAGSLSSATGASVTATPTVTTVYTVTGISDAGCSGTATVTVSVNSATSAGTIYGPMSVCAGSSITLYDSTAGISWTSSDASVATINYGGVITAVAAGTTTITYTVASGGCTGTTTAVVTVNARPSVITGTTAFCAGTSSTLSEADGGGMWSSSTSAAGSVDASGVVTGMAPGSFTVSYTFSPTGCYRTIPVTVQTAAAAIGGASSVCVGATAVVTDATSGLSWSGSDSTIATIGASSGIITGISAGTVTITYNVSSGCNATKVITVNAGAAAITGTTTVCAGLTTTLASTDMGGTWVSGNTTKATIGSASGIVTGVAAGTSIITYTLASGCKTTTTVTVNAAPAAITGSGSVCIGSTSALTSSPAGGTWSSSDATIASTGTTGIVTGVATGATNINYALSNGCSKSATVTVSSLGAISGPSSVCVGSPATFTAPATGGTWSSSNTAVASVSTAGVVSGFAAGVVNITYTVGGGCRAITTVTVNTALPNITGATSVCIGSAITLANTVTGGTWSTAGTFVTVDGSTGVVTGASAGTGTVTYTAGSGCYKTYAVTAKALPSAIGGTLSACVGGTTTLTNATTGSAAWSSSTPSVATIVAGSGVATGVSAGTSTITYTLATGCTATAVLTINALPSAITGASSVCAGAATTLSTTSTGGTWSSSTTTVATVGSATGVVTGVAAGAATITYNNGGCRATKVITVNAQPTAIGGTTSLCLGSTSTLTSGTGGTWSSANTGVATVGSTGIVTGISADTTSIIYTLASGCARAAVVTVTSAPVISGTGTVCIGNAATFTSTATGGTWASSTTAVATAGASTGVITGVAAGTSTITYAISTTCRATTVVTVSAGPAAIAGAAAACSGATTTLTDATSGGTWSSSNTGIATVGSATGIVTGAGTGTVNITYALGAGCYKTKSLTIGTGASSVTGSNGLCVGGSTTFSATTTGSSWSSSNTSVATIGSISGVATGVAPGVATISFTATGTAAGCVTTVQVTVDAGVSMAAITGTATVYTGHTVTLSDATAGGVWSSTNTALATITSGGVVTGVAAGFPIVSYTVTTGACVQAATLTMHVVASKPGTIASATTDILHVYPNPANGMFTVDAPSAGTFTVYTLEGKELMSNMVAEGSNAISLPNGTAAGIYMCRYMGTDGAIATVRLVYGQ